MTQPDWADEIVIRYMTREGLSRHGIDEAEELMASLAKELRKAKADGLRHAIELIIENGGGPEYWEWFRHLADKIENGGNS